MELVFEIGCEELPASFIAPALEQMEVAFRKGCADMRLEPGAVHTLATPRRLTLLVRGAGDRQPDLEEERTGPPAAVAFKDGAPTGAAMGFARGQGVAVEDLYTVTTEKGDYVAAKVFEAGKPASEILPGLLQEILEGLHFPKSMRWGSQKKAFARPVRWILALVDGAPLTVEFAGVTSGAMTYGHRFVAPEAIAVTSVDDYVQKLGAATVTLEPAVRREQIVEACAEHAEAAGGRIVEDPELVDEVKNLVEAVFPVTLNYDEKYLELPREVLISSMRSHQRYFAVEEKGGERLLPACVVIYNTPVRDPQLVAAGNLRVLRARLDDARFFWEKDLATPLEAHLSALESVIWVGPLGSMLQRSRRMSQVAGAIAAAMGLSAAEQESARRAGLLAKADLVTGLVAEFPDLQGVMGREYALKAGEDAAVAKAIGEQYLPTSPEDGVPTTAVSAAVALAEKLDAIVGCFGVGMIPGSTSDPYGLRRAALGVIRILGSLETLLSPAQLIHFAIDAYGVGEDSPLSETADLGAKVEEFLLTRLRFLLAETAPTNVVKAVLAADVPDVPSVYGRVEALQALRSQPDFEPLALGFKRVTNILRKQAEGFEGQAVNPELFEDPAEGALVAAAEKAATAVQTALDSRQWTAALEALIELKAPVDTFFDTVMVMAEDEAVQKNRLAILSSLRDLFLRVADISEI